MAAPTFRGTLRLMPYDPDRHRRRSIRLPDHDYTAGAFFVTICTHGREAVLAEPAHRRIVEDAWAWLPQRFDNVELDEFVVMQDHGRRRTGVQPATQGRQTPPPYPG